MLEQQQTAGAPEWKTLYPFQSRYLDSGGHRQHYVDEGQGKPLLFVHGNPTWSFYYRNLVKRMSSTSRAVAVDHIGCGLSDKPQEYDYCLQQHVDNLVGLIESLDLSNTTLVAHDWGGAIGLGALLRCRERFEKIVLFNTGAFPPPYIPFRIRVCRWPVVGPLAVRGLNGFARAAITMATELKDGLPGSVADGLVAPYDNWNNRVAIQRFVDDIPLRQSHRTWKLLNEIENGLTSLHDMPIKLIWGMKDWCFREECLDRFQRHWPHAEVHRIEDAGHYVVEDANELVCDLTAEFFEKNNGSS